MPSFTTERRNEKRIAEKKIVVCYHGDCSDGFAGAWAAWKKFGARAEYIPLSRNEAVPDLRNKEVYMIDFMYSPEITRNLMQNNLRVTGIDHHITAKQTTLMTYKPSFAIGASGATLAWKYFHPGKKTPMFLRYVEDRDIWTWKMPHAKELLSAIEFPYNDFKKMSRLVDNIERVSFRSDRIKEGKVYLAYEDRMYKKLMELAEPVQFEGHNVLAVNAPHMFASKLGNLLVVEKKAPFAIIWTREGDMINVSLRAGKKVDVSKIAEKYGGGGHKAAAGLRLDAKEPLPWKYEV